MAEDETIRELQVRWMQAWIEKDLATLERILAPDFTLLVSARPEQLIDRALWLRTAIDSYHGREFRYESSTVRFLGDLAVVASPKSSNEELFLVKKLAADVLATPNLAFTSRTPGEPLADDFLIKTDKNPNTKGAALLGLREEAFDGIVRMISEKKIKALLVFGSALADMNDAQTRSLLESVPFVAQVGTNDGRV